MHRWRHRRVTFSEALTPEIVDGLVYTDNATPPNTTVVIAQYRPGGGTTDVDRLLGCTIVDRGGVIEITGLSTWLRDEVHIPPLDAEMTVYVHPNHDDCSTCP